MKYPNMIFDSANLTEACFETSIFVQSTFKGSDLKKAILCNSHLEDVDFPDSDLSDANFDGATIINAYFSSANLCRTNFQNAKIINSIWPRRATIFYDTVFTNAIISSARLRSSIPSSVSVTFLLPRISSFFPSSSSRSFNCRERGGCVIRRVSAALVMLSSLATVRKYCKNPYV